MPLTRSPVTSKYSITSGHRMPGQADFWLHLEMNGSAPLADLDHYLRAIWLECCGHLSRFSIGGWSGTEIPKKAKVGQVFEPGVQLTHIYDFGTSSETLVKVIASRRGKPLTAHPITLMARNNLPEVRCIEGDQPASWLCIECLYELANQEPYAIAMLKSIRMRTMVTRCRLSIRRE